MIKVNAVKKFYKNHRTLVVITVHRNFFERFFLWKNKTKEISFIGYGDNFVELKTK